MQKGDNVEKACGKRRPALRHSRSDCAKWPHMMATASADQNQPRCTFSRTSAARKNRLWGCALK